jgi:hypothetical protein
MRSDLAFTRSCAWQRLTLPLAGPYPWLRSARPGLIFPLDALTWLHGALVAKLQAACKSERDRWRGLRRLAIDKTTLTLPESKSLWKAFGSHSGQQGLGPIAVELCCLFDLVSRAPLRFVYARSSTSEHKLIRKLVEGLRKGDLLLMDNGFYYCQTFLRILGRKAHFLIPAKITLRPQVLRTFAPGDYLCRILDSHTREPLTVRVVFVYRNGFRRRRLITSLLDPSLYPAEELAQLYHMRWDIETFYRDFKRTLNATSWHCQTPTTFHQELIMHMIAVCLIRIAMLDASRLTSTPVGALSFVRVLTEARLFLQSILSAAAHILWSLVWTQFVHSCAHHRVRAIPGRQFTRDRQEYRRKSRGLEKRRLGRKPKQTAPHTQPPKPESFKNLKGEIYLLS